MYMTIELNRKRLSNKADVIELFLTAINERRLNKGQSESIARDVFDRTHPSQLTFELPHELTELRNEFGALEAPGLPEDNSDPEEYRDALWDRLLVLVHEKSTV
jgi:hypothetical protein